MAARRDQANLRPRRAPRGEMTGLGAAIVAAILLTVGGYLVTRLAIYSSGWPRVSDRLLAALEIDPKLRGSRPSPIDAGVSAAILLLLELAVARTITDAFARDDLFTVAVFALQFLGVSLWWLYLRSRAVP